MTVRREIAELRREIGARRPENPRRTRAVRCELAIAAEVLMNNAG